MENQNPYQTPTGNLAGEDGYGEINFFSPSSRIGRVRYLAHGMLVGLAFYVVLAIVMLVGISAEGGALFWILLVPPYLFILYCSVLFMVQRLHDLNRSGWLWLLMIVPLVNFIFALYILFAPGTKGSNDYGLRPPPNKVWHWVLACIVPVAFIAGIVAAIALPAYQDYTRRAQEAQQEYQLEEYEEEEYQEE